MRQKTGSKLLRSLLALAIVVSTFTGIVPWTCATAYAQDDTSVVEFNGITFNNEWTSDNSLPRVTGNYYLTQDVTISAGQQITDGWQNIKVYLNGHSISDEADGYALASGNKYTTYEFYGNGESISGNGSNFFAYLSGSEGDAVVANGISLSNFSIVATLNGGRPRFELINGNITNCDYGIAAGNGSVVKINESSITGSKTVGIRQDKSNEWYATNLFEVKGNCTIDKITLGNGAIISFAGEARLTDVAVVELSGSPVPTDTTPVVFTANGGSSKFTSGSTEYDVRMNDNNEWEAYCPHVHNFAYSVGSGENANTITASCANCDITDGLSMTLSAPENLTYDGGVKAAALNADYNKTAFPDEYTIKYYRGETEVLAEDVKGAGDYTAKVTVGTGEGAATASVDFTIAKADPKVTAPKAKKLTYTGSAQELVSAGKAEGGEMQYALGADSATAPAKGWGASVPSGTDVGTYHVWYRVAGDADHNDAAPRCVKSTISKAATLTVTATDYEGTYDGKAHGIAIKVAPKSAGATVWYGTKRLTAKNFSAAGSTTPVTRTEVGTTTVHYYVEAPGREAVTGSNKIVVEPLASPAVDAVAHVQRTGDLKASGGAVAGTTGRSLRLEALSLALGDTGVPGGIEYRSHLQGVGWEGAWSRDGALSGTKGQSRRLEAVQVRLYGKMKATYDVYYRVHVQGFGWMAWAKNGEKAGSQGMSRRVEAVQVVLVLKGAKAPAEAFKGATQAYATAFVKR